MPASFFFNSQCQITLIHLVFVAMIVYPSFWITMKWFLINQEKEKKWKRSTCQDFLSIFYQDPHLFSVDTLIQANLDLRKIYLLNLKNGRLKKCLKVCRWICKFKSFLNRNFTVLWKASTDRYKISSHIFVFRYGEYRQSIVNLVVHMKPKTTTTSSPSSR